MLVLEIITYMFIAALIVLLLSFAIFGVFYLVHFHFRRCKHCGHIMEYKGLKPDGDNGYYLFHCPECGNWEKIVAEEFYQEANEDLHRINPNNL